MIKLIKIRATAGLKILGDFIADSKDEVTAGAKIVGMSENEVPDFGSTLLTTSGEIAIFNSSSEWVWQGEEETTSSAAASVQTRSFSIPRSIDPDNIVFGDLNFNNTTDEDTVEREEMR